MAVMPCPTRVNCDGFAGNPVTNFSSEQPDVLTFLALGFGPNFSPYLGWQWGATSSFTPVDSPISPEDARIKAVTGSINDTTGTWINPNGGGPPPPPAFFRSNAQQGVFDCPDGLPFFFDVPAGKFSGPTQDEADSLAIAYANEQAKIHQLCFSDLPDVICQGAAVNLEIVPSSDFLSPPGSNVWQVSTGLPDSVDFTGPGTGPATLTGTPTTPGDFNFVVGVTLPNGDFNQKEYFITVAGCTNGNALPDATQGTAYNATLTTFGFTNPQFSVSDIPPPDGLSLDSFGNITGTPSGTAVSGSFDFFVRDTVTGFTCSQTAQINVKSALDFTKLVWTIYDNSGGGQYIPEPSIGATVHFRTQLPLSQIGERDQQGHMNKGGSGSCNCHVVLTGVSSMIAGDQVAWKNPGTNQSFIKVYTNDGITFNQQLLITVATDMPTDGTYDFPFTIPNDGMPFIDTFSIFSPDVPSTGGPVVNVTFTFTPHT